MIGILNNKEVYITAQETGGGGTKNEYWSIRRLIVKTIDEKLILKNRDPLLMDDILKKVGLK